MLAAIHLQLRDRKDLLPAYNCKFSYLAERSVHGSDWARRKTHRVLKCFYVVVKCLLDSGESLRVPIYYSVYCFTLQQI